jgi:hypothetical protein
MNGCMHWIRMDGDLLHHPSPKVRRKNCTLLCGMILPELDSRMSRELRNNVSEMRDMPRELLQIIVEYTSLTHGDCRKEYAPLEPPVLINRNSTSSTLLRCPLC